jgi:hypothetical protein
MSRITQLQSALAKARDRVAHCRARYDACRAGDGTDCSPYRWQLDEARRAYDYLADELARARHVAGMDL